ncbi:MAG: D-alanyl-D-alanine carboxypeptidase/D-alanyl-D-alanine-endopeptidase [Actinobacteria bacterium]|nr:D-alanyl-D-alanine carboxypeptidase/D-alanyl-D-alanine-endopeptidase [Actinomycetota bacterium]
MSSRNAAAVRAFRCWVAAALLALFVGASALAPAAARADLRSSLDHVLVRYHLAQPGTAVRVWNLDTGKHLYGRNGHTLLVPASNQKLVTSATAFARWGVEHRFRTELWSVRSGPDASGVLHGSIIVKGYGDPSLSSTRFQRRVLGYATSDIAHFVRALQRRGVTAIRGRVLADESYFDNARTVAGWKASFVAECGPLSALSLDQGTPGGRRVAEPAVYVANELRTRLIAAGITVTGGARLGAVPEGATLLHTEYSAPLRRIVRHMNKRSDNFTAEMLIKGLGKEFGRGGTTTAGAVVERAFLVDCGVDVAEVRLRDGSGLHYRNRLSAAAVARLLRELTTREDFSVYQATLPLAGVDGTLRWRMRDTPAAGNLRGKTGTLSIASSLSGYVTTANGQKLVFSVLMNGSSLDIATARRAQDAIGALLARSRP